MRIKGDTLCYCTLRGGSRGYTPISEFAKECFAKYEGMFKIGIEFTDRVLFVNKECDITTDETFKFGFWLNKNEFKELE